MAVIFLNTDGVLTNQQYLSMFLGRAYTNYSNIKSKTPKDLEALYNYIYDHSNQIDKSKISILNYLLYKSKADIVLTGKWRLQYSLDKFNDILKRSGAKWKAMASTPYLYKDYDGRVTNHVDELELSIESLHRKGHDLNNFIILDDRSDWGKYQANLVKVNYDRGLRHLDVEKCFDRLKIPYKKS